MKIILFAVIPLFIAGCIYLTGPGTPPLENVKPNGTVEYKFDWNGLWFYLTQIIAASRWAFIEWKHRKLVIAGKKDENRDGEED